MDKSPLVHAPPPPPPAYASYPEGTQPGVHAVPPPLPPHPPAHTIEVGGSGGPDAPPPHVEYAQHNLPPPPPPRRDTSGTDLRNLPPPPAFPNNPPPPLPTHPTTSRKISPSTAPRRLPPAFNPSEASSNNVSLSELSLSAQPFSDDNAPDEFIRDPHKLIAYLVPLPPPGNFNADTKPPPLRFLTYTPPPPPLVKTPDEDAGKVHKVLHKAQYKWQEEVREAHETNAKVTSWKGFKSRLTKAIDWGMSKTTSADLDFVNRIPSDGDKVHHKPANTSTNSSTNSTTTKAADGSSDDPQRLSTDSHHVFHDDGVHEEETTKATVKLDELVLIYPITMDKTEKEIREEFINSLMRTKTKAQRDAVIATGLLPVSVAVDTLLMFVGWVFGGLFEVDAVWAANSLRGAKTARSVTKRLASSTKSGSVHDSDEHIQLRFVASARAEPLQNYLLGQCLKKDVGMFSRPRGVAIPTGSDVLTAIGWHNSGVYQKTNWEDEAWEREQVEEDLEKTFKKAASAWDKWLMLYEKNPEKALKK
ncbi:uncharacterized protein LOC62_04G005963 [Vanrija pseudolonga]|uniref:Uncharacterized protein n=1 Tax=Vanrija pseudolonga TaxID=143232 RepID=A0AAF0Y9C8_9TREE|nr:hypothetical protein LOC62_04G005963 [Vanrija pseudolonga]